MVFSIPNYNKHQILLFLGVCVVLSIAVPFALHIYNKWPGTLIIIGPENGDPNYFDKNYIVPWCRFSPYIGGVVLGYILYRTKDKQIKIPRASCGFCLLFNINRKLLISKVSNI